MLAVISGIVFFGSLFIYDESADTTRERLLLECLEKNDKICMEYRDDYHAVGSFKKDGIKYALEAETIKKEKVRRPNKGN